MSYYRLYFMRTFSGHIERFEEFEAADDAEATSQAQARQCDLALELWCSHRKVARVEPVDLGARILAKRQALNLVKAQLEPQLSAEDAHSQDRSG